MLQIIQLVEVVKEKQNNTDISYAVIFIWQRNGLGF